MDVRPTQIPVISSELADLVASGDDAALLRIIAVDRESNPDWASAALMELHKRHVMFLYPVCQRICNLYLGNANETDDLLQRLMWRVYNKAEKFDSVKAGCAGDYQRTERAVRAWMCRQAKWLAKEVITPAVRRSNDGGSEVVEQLACQEECDLFELRESVEQLLNRLSPRERHVVLASFFFIDMDSGGLVPSNEHVDDFCARRWNTTAPNIRKIRSRAIETLREPVAPVGSRATAAR